MVIQLSEGVTAALVVAGLAGIAEFIRLEVVVKHQKEKAKEQDKSIIGLRKERQFIENKLFDKLDDMNDKMSEMNRTLGQIQGELKQSDR